MKKYASEYKLDKLTTMDIAILGTWLDDPYGDGIRLEHIRKPSMERQVACKFISEPKTCDMFADNIIENYYGGSVRKMFNKKTKQLLKRYWANAPVGGK